MLNPNYIISYWICGSCQKLPTLIALGALAGTIATVKGSRTLVLNTHYTFGTLVIYIFFGIKVGAQNDCSIGK
jgi:hypothetical protein